MGTRVVITGMGVFAPGGTNLADFWAALTAGRSAVRLIDRFDIEGLATQFAGLCEDPVPAGLDNKELRRQDRVTLMAMVAADEAWAQAGLDMDREDPYRCGVIVGSGIGGLQTISDNSVICENRGPRKVAPTFIPKGLINMAAGLLAIRYGLQGPNKGVVSACASGNHALGDAADCIRLGKADVVVSGGAEAGVTRLGVAGFNAMRALSTRNDAPERASRPFDKDRDGFVMGEGAALFVLESEAHARARGADILCEVAGMGETNDANHIVAPREDGAPVAKAIRIALDEAGLNPSDVDYYNAHGTSTPLNDPMEARALQTVFGDDAPLVSSTKSMTGHLLGAASAIEAVASIQAIRTGVVAPNINYETPDPACPVPRLVANTAQEAQVDVVVSNGLGFGGHNAAVVLRRYG